jgi:uncharacterized protein YjbI with pentapeptide repeats
VLTVIVRRDAKNRNRETNEVWLFDLNGTDLRRTVLLVAHLKRAVLFGAHLEGADLTAATGLTAETLAVAFGNAHTKCRMVLRGRKAGRPTSRPSRP